jgi:DNA-binding transcriptional LysR family regulator
MRHAADRFEGLTVFLTVARRYSFRAAAVELGVTASAVSQAIRALERKIGLPLFSRTTRRVGLIRYRLQHSGIYRWELVRDHQEITVDVPGPLTVNDGALALSMARAGLGLAYVNDLAAAEDLASGALETALDRYAPAGSGFFLYFPARAQEQAKLRAFIDTALAVLAPERKRPARSRHAP